MKTLRTAFIVLSAISLASITQAQTQYRLNPLNSFGSHTNGTILPGDDTPQNLGSADLFESIFNQRGMAIDPVTTNLVIVDTHSGSGGSGAVQGGIYILDGTYGTNLLDGANPLVLNTNGINGGSYADSPVVVADDGAVYVANQVVASSSPVTIYRFDSSTTTNAPTIAFTGTLAPVQRYGVTMDVRGAGPTTQIIMGSSSQSGASGTNVVIFTTSDGTNFTANVLATDVPSFNFIEGTCWGAGNTFWAKAIGTQLRLMSYDLVNSNAVTLKVYPFTQLIGSENLGPIDVDTNLNLLAAIEESNGLPNGGPERVWLYDISNTNNPALLDIKDYTPDFQNATAPPGYLNFFKGRLYTHVINNGMVAYSLDLEPAPAPIVVRAPAATNRLVQTQSIGLTVLAYPNVGYEWRSNNVPIPNATNSTLNLNNVTTNFAALYTCVVTNAGGSTNVSTRVEVVVGTDLFHLNLVWRVGAGDGKLWMSGGSHAGVPDQRMLGYNALSNHLYVFSRQSNTTSNYVFHVLNAADGNLLWTMKTNGVTCAVGQGGIGLAGIAVAADGAIYGANIANNANGDGGADPTKSFRIYRWADGNSNTLPVQIWIGDPALGPSSSTIQRWGDSFTLRGSGTNTQLLLDCSTKTGGNTLRNIAILYPTDNTMTNWSSTFMIGTNAGNVASTSIGHSIQFEGTNNIVYQKVAQVPLSRTSFDPTSVIAPGPPTWIGAAVLAAYGGFSNRLCGVGLDLSRNLAAGVIKPTPASDTDVLALYDISSLAAPLLLAQYNFPVTPHNVDANLISHTIFAGSNIFSLDAGNGIMAFHVATGPASAPTFIIQPQSMRLVLGGGGPMSAATLEAARLQWQRNTGGGFTNIAGATNNTFSILGAQLSDAGGYRVVATNDFSGSGTSLVATVSVSLPDDQYSLASLWAIAPADGNGNVINGGGGGVPFQRTMAYNPLSNHLYVVSRLSPGSISNYVVYVLNASDGTLLSTLNTNGIYNAGAVGEGGIGLVGIGVSDDGSIYICNVAPDACGCGPNTGGTNIPADSLFRIYRWANDDSNTLPIQVFSGDPAGQTSPIRWGDSMTVRGGGINTEILLDNNQGTFAAVLKPSDAFLTNLTTAYVSTQPLSTLIGRSLQFGSSNTFWQHRAQTPLRLSSYDLGANTSTLLASYNNFPIGLGPVALDFSRKIMVGIETNGVPAISPDSATLFEISDLNTPMVVARYSFPSAQQNNVNDIGAVVFAGNRVWALDANNGLMAFTIQGPKLTIVHSGNNTIVSWTTNLGPLMLQATPSLSPPITWTNVGTGTISGDRYVLTNSAGAATLFYRLQN